VRNVSGSGPLAAGSSAGSPPADWYDNPLGVGLRFWDGAAWTGHVAYPKTTGPGHVLPEGSAHSSDENRHGRRRLASSPPPARVVIDLAMVLVLVLVIVVGIASTQHKAAAPTPIVEAAGGSSTTSSPTTTTEVPTTQAVPTTVAPTTVPTTAPPVTVAPTTVAPTTAPVTVPRTTGTPPPPVPKPAPPQTLLTLSNEGGETTQSFVVPPNAAQWDVQWTYNCSANGGAGNFAVEVFNESGRDLNDAAVSQTGTGGSGTQYYQDQGTFSLQITSNCIWSIQAAVP